MATTTSSSSTHEPLVYNKVTGDEKDEHHSDLSSTDNTNLNSSVDNLAVPKNLFSELNFDKQGEQKERKLSAPHPETLSLTLNPVKKGDKLRCSYIDRLMHKGIMPK
jgi:hypothetical protein